jgi:hypothetical protein
MRRANVGVRLNPETFALVEQVARSEQRTVSNLLRIVIEEWARVQRPVRRARRKSIERRQQSAVETSTAAAA